MRTRPGARFCNSCGARLELAAGDPRLKRSLSMTTKLKASQSEYDLSSCARKRALARSSSRFRTRSTW